MSPRLPASGASKACSILVRANSHGRPLSCLATPSAQPQSKQHKSHHNRRLATSTSSLTTAAIRPIRTARTVTTQTPSAGQRARLPSQPQSRTPHQQQSSPFSTTAPQCAFSLPRRAFLKWLRTVGHRYKKHNPSELNYLGVSTVTGAEKRSATRDCPFPLNSQFTSFPVLDDSARETIWDRIMRKGHAIKAVSADLGVDINRVAAVVRMKEIEKDWIAKGKPLARPYARAVLQMIPTHSYEKTPYPTPLEPINELHVHPRTMRQLFWPTSESKHFTRQDAAEAFGYVKSADERVPHPELVEMERDIVKNQTQREDAVKKFSKIVEKSERAAAEALREQERKKKEKIISIEGRRCEFRFENYNAENIGYDGRKINAVGWKYGRPHYDRKKGIVHIPTSVP